MNKKYIVRLSNEERQQLIALTTTGKAPAYRIKHANILLQVDADGPNPADHDVAKTFHCHGNTVRISDNVLWSKLLRQLSLVNHKSNPLVSVFSMGAKRRT